MPAETENKKKQKLKKSNQNLSDSANHDRSMAIGRPERGCDKSTLEVEPRQEPNRH